MLVTSLLPAALIGIAVSASTLFVQIPFGKGRIAEINENKGQRIASVVVLELMSTLAYIFIWLVFLISASVADQPRNIFVAGFVVSAIATVLLPLHRARGVKG